MTSQNRCLFGRRTLSSCFSAWLRFDMVKTVKNFSILCKNHQWLPVSKQIKNLQISLISVRNPQWFVQEYFSIFVPISSISCRNHQWFLQEKRHTFFQNFSIFSKNHQWFLEAKKQKIFKFRWFLSEIPNDLSRNIFPFSFRFHRFRAEITNDFCNQKTHIFSEFLDFGPKSPMIYVGKKNVFCEFFQNSSISCKNHHWFPQEKKIRKSRGFHSIGKTPPDA